MEQPTHYKLVWALKKPPGEIYEELALFQLDAIHMALGIAGEAGEIAEVMQHWFHGDQTIDRTALIEELGDMEFYLEGLRQALGVLEGEIFNVPLPEMDGYDHRNAHATTLNIVIESGNLVDVVKRNSMYQKPLERNRLIETLVQTHFYLGSLYALFGITREEVLQANIDKLQTRYHEGKFTNEQAQARADKQ